MHIPLRSICKPTRGKSEFHFFVQQIIRHANRTLALISFFNGQGKRSVAPRKKVPQQGDVFYLGLSACHIICRSQKSLTTAIVSFSSALSPAAARQLHPLAEHTGRYCLAFGYHTDQRTTPCNTRLPGTDELPRLAQESRQKYTRCLCSCSPAHRPQLRSFTSFATPTHKAAQAKAAPDRKPSHLCIRCRVTMQRAGAGTRVGERHSDRNEILQSLLHTHG